MARTELRLMSARLLFDPSQARESDGKWQPEGKGSKRHTPKAAPATRSIRINPHTGATEEVRTGKPAPAKKPSAASEKKAAAAKQMQSPEQKAAMESLKKKVEAHKAKRAASHAEVADHPKTVDEALTHFPTQTRVRISDIHKKLPHLSKEQINQELLKGQAEGKHVIYRIDDPTDIGEDDKRTAINVAGFPRHIIYRGANQPVRPGAEHYVSQTPNHKRRSI